MIELKPCPFCGKPGEIYYNRTIGCADHYVFQCGRIDTGIRLWNTRSLQAEPMEENKKEFIDFVRGFKYSWPNENGWSEYESMAHSILKHYIVIKREE